MVTKFVDTAEHTKCNHVYSPECDSCGEDNTYRWIVCARYKKDCPDFACIKCGEIETLTEKESK